MLQTVYVRCRACFHPWVAIEEQFFGERSAYLEYFQNASPVKLELFLDLVSISSELLQ